MVRAVFILTFLIFSVCFGVLVLSKWIWILNQSRRKGYRPINDKPTMFHVRDLIIRGEKELAVYLYCEIFKTNRQDAIKAVNELERSIQKK